ncbi:beta-ketoacyl-ACP synthase 3 [Candidatus Nesciobacter abundans]|uniref:Beta-ketoacyl-ACP synthase 3 n=1 Tax=Candidatus Nesciobacter abundans TaxID=2601668 RepID=A0A5C0UHW9_9PROT|nr:beta-ketoacyl-ACP synthase 3 [Candidatus Nesciobacter abundans]QEK39173.1 beta-ketoacyl-ACP synthase 3 [Candidatus Nesciobacter abundans]
MNGMLIKDCGIFVPSNCVSNFDLQKKLDTSDEWIKTRTGISSRFIAEKETTYSMAYESAKNLNLGNVKIILCATSTPDCNFPTCSSYVHGKLGLGKDVMCFDIHDACNGFVQAFTTAMVFLQNMPEDSEALIIGSEKMSSILDWNDRSTAVLFGDGAGAVLVNNKFGKLLKYSSYSKPSFDSLNVENTTTKINDKEFGNGSIKMNGQDVFKNACSSMREDVINIVKESGEVDWFIPHQANLRILKKVSENLSGIKNLVYNGDKYGNTSAASIPLALYDVFKEGKLSSGQKLLFTGFAAGFRWGSVLVQL